MISPNGSLLFQQKEGRHGLLFLSQTALFRGCSPRETADMLQCLRAERRVYEKDRVICHAGDTVEALGLVLSGGVNIESVDVWGSRSILGHVGPGQVLPKPMPVCRANR